MKKVLFSAFLAVLFLVVCLAGAVQSSPNLMINQETALARAGSFASSPAVSINIGAIDTGKAASGNSMPVNLTADVTRISGGSNAAEAVCGLERFDFEIDTLQVPAGGKAARIMSVSPIQANFMYAPPPCSYWISIIPITDYLNSGSPQKPSPAKQNTWVNGVYTLSLRYMDNGNEIASKTFSFTIGSGMSLMDSKFNTAVGIDQKLSRDQKLSPGHVVLDPVNQLNPQPEPPMPPVASGHISPISRW